jgi:F1F0 ATPase subunit 2
LNPQDQFFMNSFNALNPLLFGALGLLVGLWHFGSLRWLTQRLVSASGPGWTVFLLLQMVRIGVLVVAGLFAVRHGAWPLLALALGVLAARALWLLRVRRAGASET